MLSWAPALRLKAALVALGVQLALASHQVDYQAACEAAQAGACAVGPEDELSARDEADARLLEVTLLQEQSTLRLQRKALGEAGGEAEQEQPFWERLAAKRRAQAQQEQAAAQKEQQSQQEFQQAQQTQDAQMQSAPPPLQAINRFLQRNVTTRMNVDLPLAIKNKGMDPVPQLTQKQNLNVNNLSGMSTINITSFWLTSVELGLNASGLGGTAHFELRAEIPQMQAQISRHGVMGGEQTYQLALNGAQVTAYLTGVVGLVNGTTLVAQSIQSNVKAVLKSTGVTGDGPQFLVGKLDQVVHGEQEDIQAKLAEHVQRGLDHAFSKLLPMPLDMNMSSS